MERARDCASRWTGARGVRPSDRPAGRPGAANSGRARARARARSRTRGVRRGRPRTRGNVWGRGCRCCRGPGFVAWRGEACWASLAGVGFERRRGASPAGRPRLGFRCSPRSVQTVRTCGKSTTSRTSKKTINDALSSTASAPRSAPSLGLRGARARALVLQVAQARSRSHAVSQLAGGQQGGRGLTLRNDIRIRKIGQSASATQLDGSASLDKRPRSPATAAATPTPATHTAPLARSSTLPVSSPVPLRTATRDPTSERPTDKHVSVIVPVYACQPGRQEPNSHRARASRSGRSGSGSQQ